jgi:hypothetical protein
MQTVNVSWGPSSVIGFLAAAAAAVAPIIGELADAANPLGVPPAVWVTASALLTVVTVIGRMWQAAAAAGAGVVRSDVVVTPPVNPEG